MEEEVFQMNGEHGLKSITILLTLKRKEWQVEKMQPIEFKERQVRETNIIIRVGDYEKMKSL